MKILKVLGVLVVLGAIVVIGGGYWAYKNGGAKLAAAAEQEVEKFITDKQIPEVETASLRRLMSAAKTQDSMNAIILLSVAGKAMEDEVISSNEVSLMDEGSQMAEQNAFTKESLQAYASKIDQVIPATKK